MQANHFQMPPALSQPPPPAQQVGDFLLEYDLLLHPMVKECLARRASDNASFLMRIYERGLLLSQPMLNMLVKWEQEVLSQVQTEFVTKLVVGLQNQEYIFNVMTLSSDETLNNRLERQGPFSEKQALDFMKEIMISLNELTAFQYLPRIISNSCFRFIGDHICIDFYGNDRNRMLIMNEPPPLVLYESPEHLQVGISPILDRQSDVWSLGLCFYEMLYGRLPWPAQHTPQEMVNLAFAQSGDNLPFPPSPAVSPELVQLLREMISFDPVNRKPWDLVLNFFTETSNPPAFANMIVTAPTAVIASDIEEEDIPVKERKSFYQDNNKSFSIMGDVGPTSLFSSMVLEKVVEREPISTVVQETPKNVPIANKLSRRKQTPAEVKASAPDKDKPPIDLPPAAPGSPPHRLQHEMQINYFTVEGVEDIQGMISILKEQPSAQALQNGLIVCAVLLAKQTVDRNWTLCRACQQGEDYFGLGTRMVELMNSPHRAAILKDCKEEEGTFQTTLKETVEGMTQGTPQFAEIQAVLESTPSPLLQPTLEKYASWLFSLFLDSKRLFASELKYHLRTILGRIFMCANSGVEFAYLKGSNLFDWGKFLVYLDRDFLLQTYKLGVKHYTQKEDLMSSMVRIGRR